MSTLSQMMEMMALGGTGPSTDPYWANVVALLHMDGSSADQKGRAWTDSGVSYSTTTYKWPTGSLQMGGASSAVVAASSADFGFGTGDFTVECWANAGPSPVSGRYVLDVGSNGLVFLNTGATWGVYTAGGASRPSSVNVIANTWVHLAYCVSSGTARAFVNGVVFDTRANPDNFPTATMTIGNYGGLGYGWTGFVDDVRVTKGVGRYTSNFTPPAAPFPNS